jgi:malonyl-CoA/methylmalonyl-CoA synthetase
MHEPDYNLFAHFALQFASQAGKDLLETSDGRCLTYADVNRLSAQMAEALTDVGVQPGDRVSVQVQKSPENLCLYLACLRAGFVFHPLNMGYKRAELEYFIANAEPSVVICDGRNEGILGEIARSNGVEHVLTMNADGHGSLLDAAVDEPAEFASLHRSKDDLAALLYSSGTTGIPKGAMLTHGNLLANTEALVAAWGFTDKDRLLHALPVFHVHGLFVGIGCVLLSGASMCWLQTFDARKVMSYLEHCSVMMGVPTYYTRLLAEPAFDRSLCRNVRLFISGSAPLLTDTFDEFEARTGQRILERYGMTETNMNTSNPLEGDRKPGTVGPALPGIAIRVVDDHGTTLASGEVGNLEVKGPNVFIGYWRLQEKTQEDFAPDGYFKTGDMASLDEDGYVSIVGRAKDVVITGGLNVYPKEIELFIDELPGVKESAVIGVPHADFGEAVVAVVVPMDERHSEEQDVIRACKAALADFKVPKRVIFVDELPRNTMAKVQKKALRESYGDLFS